MNNAKKSLVPHRRFKEFQNAGAWEQRKFMDLIDSIIDFRGRTPKKLGMNWSNEGLLALSAQNVKDGYIDKTIDAHYGSQTLYDKWMNGRELHKGQVVFTTEAPMGNVARIPDENKYILSQRTIAFTVKNTVLTEGFLMYLLESPSVKNNLLRISSGGTAKGVSQKTLSSLTVKIPTSLKEQERINFVFYSLDSLITLHQRKLNKLKKLKSAYLTEMFPDEGEHKPKRRFAGFTDDWEQRKLGDVVERFDNLRIPVTSSKRKRGITPYYGANGIQDYVQGYTHDGEFVLVAEDGANDLQNYPIHYVNGKVWVNNHAHVLQGKKDIADNLFLVNAIKRIKFETYLVGGSRAKLNADVMMKLPIKMPKLNEQQKLGKYFSRIDTLIALHQRELKCIVNTFILTNT